ncbi:DUF4166 domain-containing protein [Saccharophagus degradans]|uniref:DUF4166 domain-containing protein n=1 Tax=Saccharophagus degradans (strain 2-40 / ATCC 43961 / DSM 17024) TaxID=203122 RepID=Q21HT7_SACD2|nr:DUF4166 domain-containing protein [Saccharophagus degradans]ABD81742.1 hypothetical protein Sde_2482 [Saccharophagus degradans 2-40]
MSNLLQQCLGNDYALLCPIVKAAHTGESQLKGTVWVRQGNIFARALCKIMAMPPQTNSVELTVHGKHDNNNMHWDRKFGNFKMNSHFAKSGNQLVEKLGPLNMHLALSVNNGTLEYRLQKTYFWGIPVPHFLAPKVEANEGEHAGLYRFSVYVFLPVIGLVVSYGGDMQLCS